MNQLYYGDNLQVLRASITDESVDLIYLDPPFNSKRDYNLLFKSPKGADSAAQIEAFEDTWHLERAGGSGSLTNLLQAAQHRTWQMMMKALLEAFVRAKTT